MADTKFNQKFQSLAETHRFTWRQGRWLAQGPSSTLAPVPAAMARILDRLMRSGALQEDPPGFFSLMRPSSRAASNPDESPLTRLLQMKFIDSAQHQAGERLRRDFDTSGLSQRVTVSYALAGSSGGRHWQISDNHIANLTDSALAARERLHRAFDEVGEELSGILYHVCCLAGGLEQAERHLKMPRRSGKAVLSLALTRLARHYRLKPPLSHSGPRQIGHWAMQDFRPTIQSSANAPPQP